MTVVWDANTEADLAGYVVSYGTASGFYTTSIDVGKITSYGVTGLTAGVPYFFVVRAYNTSGTQSPPSLEVTTTPGGTVSRVAITSASTNLGIGQASQFSAVAYDANNAAVPGVAFTWTTTSTTVAPLSATTGPTVSVTSQAAGTATLTATSNGISGQTTVTAGAPAALVTVSPTTANLIVGATASLTAQAFDSAGNPLPSAPLTWTTTNASVASLSATVGGTVSLTAAGTGAASVTVSTGGRSATATVTVVATVNHVTITPATVNLVPALTQQFVALAYDAANTPISGVAFTWTTTNTTAAPLSVASGATVTVTPQSAGTATLTATAAPGGVSGQATVTVAPAHPITRVTVTPAAANLALGKVQALTAVGLDSAGQPVPSATFTWSSSSETIATLSSATGGTVGILGYGLGTATITATEAGGLSTTATIAVGTADTLVWDTFTGANGATLSSHSPDANLNGSLWSASGSGTPTLQNGLARVTSPGTASSIVTATMSTAAPDVTVAATWRAQGTTPWGGVVLRWTDADNFLFAGYRGASELAIFRVQNAIWTRLVGAPLTVAGGTVHLMEAVTNGPLIKVYWDGTQLLQASDAFNQTVDRHGIVWGNGVDTASGYDTLRMSGIRQAATAPTPTAPSSGSSSPPPSSGSSSPAPSSGSSSPAPSSPAPGPSTTASTTPVTPTSTSTISAPALTSAPGNLIASISGATVVLHWAAPTAYGAASYVLEAGSVSGLVDQADVDTGNRLTTYTASPVPPGRYFVRLRARKDDGTISAASNEVIVDVGGAQQQCSAPTLPAPILSSTVFGSTVTLDWQLPAGGATSYAVEGGSVPGATNLVNFDTQSSATSYRATRVAAGTYFVRVRAKNICGASGAPSNELIINIGN